MVVSVGLLYRPSSVSSNPTTAMSSGTLTPSSTAARSTPFAALDIGDLVATDAGLQVMIRTSKTDRDSIGRIGAVPYLTGVCELSRDLERCDRAVQAFTRLGVVLGRAAGHPGIVRERQWDVLTRNKIGQ
jgi:hypothetical protein